MADELIDVVVLKRSDSGARELTGLAPSKDCPLAILDASHQGEDPDRTFDFPWNVTHRATGMAMPRTWSVSKEDALEYLEELLTVKGWEKVRVTSHPKGEYPTVAGLSKRIKKEAAAAIERVHVRRRDRERTNERVAKMKSA